MTLAEASFWKTGIQPVRHFGKPVIRFRMLTVMEMCGSSHLVDGCAAAAAGSGNLRCLLEPSGRRVQLVLGLGMLKDR